MIIGNIHRLNSERKTLIMKRGGILSLVVRVFGVLGVISLAVLFFFIPKILAGEWAKRDITHPTCINSKGETTWNNLDLEYYPTVDDIFGWGGCEARFAYYICDNDPIVDDCYGIEFTWCGDDEPCQGCGASFPMRATIPSVPIPTTGWFDLGEGDTISVYTFGEWISPGVIPGTIPGKDLPEGNWVSLSKCSTTNHTLSIKKKGNGSVKVNGTTYYSLPWSAKFPSGAEVELEAMPASGWYFSHWTGDLAGNSKITSITMDTKHKVKANFTKTSQNQPPIINSIVANPGTVSTGGTSTISVSASDPEGDPLSYSWLANGGTLSSSTGPGPITWTAPNTQGIYTITVYVTDNKPGHSPVSKSVTITVAITKTLSSLIVDPNSWTFSSSATKQLTAIARYSDNSTEEVTNKATWTSSNPSMASVSNSGLVTPGQNGSAVITATYGGKNGTCNVLVSINTAFALNITKPGTGSGTVTSNPPGINCGTDCEENYTANQVVSLIVTPFSDSTFAGWGGDSDCTDGSVTMTGSRNCIATFNLKPPQTKTIEIQSKNEVDDALVFAGEPDTNYGDQPELVLRKGKPDFKNLSEAPLESLIRFNLSSVPKQSTINSAIIKLFFDYSTIYESGYVRLYRALNHWDESSVTWNNRPSVSGQLEDEVFIQPMSQPPLGGLFYYFDITALLEEWYKGIFPNYGLLIRFEDSIGLGEPGIFIDSSEVYPNGTAPKLTIQLTSP